MAPQPTRRQICLTVEVESDPIRGTVNDGEHAAQDFEGWLRLAALIEDARATKSEQSEPKES